MTTVVRYVGLQPKSEVAITGLGRRWWPGELRPLDDATARLLTLAGQGWEIERDEDTYLDETAVPGGGITAPATLDGTSAAFNGRPLHLAAGATLTVAAGALAVLGAGVSIVVGQSGSATLAFSGGATKENASGTSPSSVTLAASGVYALLPSPAGSDKWRLSGGASI